MRALLEKPKVMVPIGPSVKHPFLTRCTFISPASEPWKQAMLLSMSPPEKSTLAGECWGSTTLQKSLLHSANLGGPGPTPVQVHFLNSLVALLPLTFYSFLSYTLENVLCGAQSEKLVWRKRPILARRAAPACECSRQRASTGLSSLLWNTETGIYYS